MRKSGLIFIFALLFLFSVNSVKAESSIFAVKPISAANVFEANNLQKRYTLKITNNSRYDIYKLYVSSAENEKWGPDQLEDDVLAVNTTFTLTDIIPGEYDIMFVDEDGDKCTLEDIAIFKNTAWSLTTSWLTKCQGY